MTPPPRRPVDHPPWCAGNDDLHHRSKRVRVGNHRTHGQVQASLVRNDRGATWIAMGLMRGSGISGEFTAQEAWNFATGVLDLLALWRSETDGTTPV